MQKKDGAITLDWVPIARVRPQEDGHINVEWNGVLVVAENVDKEEAMRIFRSLAKATSSDFISWAF